MDFKVKTDEKFYKRFEELSLRVKNLGNIFQNEGTVLTWDSEKEYFENLESVFDEMIDLRVEIDLRVVMED